jgi:hypothetical protein
MLNDHLIGSIVVVSIAIAITFPFALHVMDSLKRGTFNTTLLQQAIWAAVIAGSCVATMASYKPGGRDVFTGSLYVLVYFVGVIGVLASPFIGWILASYLLGYIFWRIGGRKRIFKTNETSPSGGLEKDHRMTFGKRNPPLD